MIGIDPGRVKPRRAACAGVSRRRCILRRMKKNAGKASGSGKRPPWMPESMATSGERKPAKAAASKPGTPKAAKAAKGGGSPKTRSPAPAGRSGGQGRRGPGGGAPPRSDPHATREARLYDNPIISREALIQHLADAPGPLNVEDIARHFELTAPDRLDALSRRLNAMLRDGQLLMNRRGGFAVAEQLDLIAGTVIANADGFGFLKPDKGGGDDLFLP